MKKLSILFLSLFVASFVAKAQEGVIPAFPDWDPNPQMHAIPPKYFNEHAVVIYDKETRDYKYEGKSTTLYSTSHKLIKVLDKTGIESFNVIHVPFAHNESRIDSIRARVILPDGTTRDVKYEMMYLGGQSILFALDAVEKNAEIELLVKYKAMSSYFGSIIFQHNTPVLHTFFELNYPKEMNFNTKGYHGFPSGTEQIVGGHKQVKIYQGDIPALQEQPFSFYDLYLMRLDYAIDHYNTRGGYQSGEPFTWDKFAQGIYKEYYSFTKEDSIAVGKFLTTIGIRGGETDLQKIKMIEEGIKTNIIQFEELTGSNVNNMDTIIAKKSATDYGIIKLFCGCFRATGIIHELGCTSDRREHLMDPKFINWGPLRYYFFYFPGTDQYLTPNNPYLRYPEVAYHMINNKGVFCKTNPETGYNFNNYGRDLVAPDAIIRTIPAPPADYTKISLNADITFNEEFEPEAEVTYAYTGYKAADIRVNLAAANGEGKKKIIEKNIEIADLPEKIVKYNTVNEAFNSVYKGKPLEIKATVRIPQMVEKAGNKYMFLVGQMMGYQPNIYDNKHGRILPIDLNYPETETRVITINLPEGYKILNPGALRIRSEGGDLNNDKVSAYFKSDYQLNGNKLVVTITEMYAQLHYPVGDFESFRKVINAAADFNKVGLILEQVKAKKAVKSPKAKTAAVKTPAKHV